MVYFLLLFFTQIAHADTIFETIPPSSETDWNQKYYPQEKKLRQQTYKINDSLNDSNQDPTRLPLDYTVEPNLEACGLAYRDCMQNCKDARCIANCSTRNFECTTTYLPYSP